MSHLLAELGPLTLHVALLAGIAGLLVLELVLPQEQKDAVGWSAALLCAGILAASFTIDTSGTAFAGAYRGGTFALFLQRVFLLAGALGALGSVEFLARTAPHRQGEYQLLLLSSVLGMMLLAGARDLLFLVVSFELMGVPLYLMAAYGKSEAGERGPRGSHAAEAALKLFFVGAASTAIVLFGAALLAGSAGATSLAAITGARPTPLLLTGAMLLLGGMAFKLGAAPFHFWVPDTYEGAPAPFVAFLSVGPKVAGVAALLAVLVGGLAQQSERWLPVLTAISVLSLVVGNAMALPQTGARRLLAFSGVAQMGYVLLGLAAGTGAGRGMVLFYLAAYVATNLGAFLVVHAVARSEGGDDLSGFEGLSRRAPWLSAALLMLLLSLAGIPFLVGFWAKLYVFSAALEAGLGWLVVLGALLAVVALFYYLRVVRAMYIARPRREDPVPVGPGLALSIGASVAVAVAAGLWPGPLYTAAQAAAAGLF